MNKKRQRKIEELLFEIYDTGVKHEECNITDYFEKLMQALNIPLVSISLPPEFHWQCEKCKEVFEPDESGKCPHCGYEC
jgi:rRNA maturation endonuclease Nob1